MAEALDAPDAVLPQRQHRQVAPQQLKVLDAHVERTHARVEDGKRPCGGAERSAALEKMLGFRADTGEKVEPHGATEEWSEHACERRLAHRSQIRRRAPLGLLHLAELRDEPMHAKELRAERSPLDAGGGASGAEEGLPGRRRSH